MLADTEAGSVITAAQSGAQWGYRLLLLQVLIVPLLYMVQELAARLALSTGLGYAELIRRRFGRGMAGLSVATLVASCFGALVTEMSGLVGVGNIFGIAGWITIAVLIGFILTMVATGAYQSVERIVIVLGMFELVFLVIAWKAQPKWGEIAAQLRQMPLGRADYLYLLAANLGTSVMPWSIFYQQSALIDKGLDIRHLRATRIDTATGAVLCQVVTASILIAAAATFSGRPNVPFQTVGEISAAFSGVLGTTWGHAIFAIGLSGGALVATVVVCLTAAWAIGEITGAHHSLEQHPLEAPWFYAAFALMLVLGGALVVSGLNLVRLSIAVGVLNALLLPLVLGFLYRLARSEPDPPHRLRGRYALAVGAVFAITTAVGLYAGIAGTLG
ncbi:MAG: divalent metal cation transporter [Burkholderiales bacterium]|nr:divalent metal cation transporter [Burkholderiales bacterium]